MIISLDIFVKKKWSPNWSKNLLLKEHLMVLDHFIYCILEKNIKFILILFKIFNLHLYHNNKRYKLNLN